MAKSDTYCTQNFSKSIFTIIYEHEIYRSQYNENTKTQFLIRVTLDVYYTVYYDASQWRRSWSRTTAIGSSATRGFHSGSPGITRRGFNRYPGVPLPLCSYIIRGLIVVDRTLGACLVTCSSRHVTSYLFHSYISTTHSLHPQGLCFILVLVCSRSV